MKQHSYHLHIESPCHENWDSMQEIAGGRHCQSCSKNVVDLSKLSDAEIIQILEQSKNGLCGRLREGQMNRVLVAQAPQKPSSFFMKAIASMLILTGSVSELTAQHMPKAEELALVEDRDTGPEGKPVKKSTERPGPDGVKKSVSGTVKNEIGEPVAAIIELKNTGLCIEARADGNFEILIPDSIMQDTLSFLVKSSEYVPQVFNVIRTEFPAKKDIVLKEPRYLMGVVIDPKRRY